MNLEKHTKLFVLQGLVYLAFIGQLLGVPVPQTGILIVAMTIPFFLDKEELPAYIVGFSMLGTGIQVAYIALSCSIAILYKSKWSMKWQQIILPLALMIYEVAHMLLYPADTYIELIRYLCVYFLLIYVLFNEKKASEKLLIVHSYIYATVFAVTHVFIQSYIELNGDITSFFDGAIRFGYSEQIGIDLTFSADPNLIAQSCSVSIAFCLGLILMGRLNWKYFVAMFICIIAGMLTISKTFLLSLGLIVILYILFTGNNRSIDTIKKRCFLILLILIALFAIYKVYPTYLDNISSRVIEGDITNGRTRNASNYLEYLFDHIGAMLFGVGIQNLGEKIYNGASPHAATIEVFASWGLIGIIAIVKTIIDSIKSHKGCIKPRITNYIPFLIFAILVQSTQLFRLRDRVFGLVAVIAYIGFNQQELKKEQEEYEKKESFIGREF